MRWMTRARGESRRRAGEGTLIVIGGHEDEEEDKEVLQMVAESHKLDRALPHHGPGAALLRGERLGRSTCSTAAASPIRT